MSESTGKIRATVQKGGVWYSTLFLTRAFIDRLRDRLDNRLASIERHKNLFEPWTISARRFTVADNRALYNGYDWSARGEEWTDSEEWKNGVTNELLLPNLKTGSDIVEIGPGGGRWTEIIYPRVHHVFLVDVADRSLSVCRERFASAKNISYLLSDGRTIAVPDASVDTIWSYDVFVHVNPVDARSYVLEFARILKRGGRAVIHHPGNRRINQTRSDLTDAMIQSFCREAGLTVVSQTGKFASAKSPDDLVSVIEKR